jgi:hypothetical protein
LAIFRDGVFDNPAEVAAPDVRCPDEAAMVPAGASAAAATVGIDKLKLPQIAIDRKRSRMIGFSDLYLSGVGLQQTLRVSFDHLPQIAVL